MSSPSSLKVNRRTPWQVTKSVWWALFIREALSRTMSDRLGWFWLFAQPILIVIVMVQIRTIILGRSLNISGGEFIPWLIFGLLGFQMFRETLLRSMFAVQTNRQLFAYRQVKPIDPVMVRCYIEGLLNTFIFLLFIMASFLLDFSLMPDDPVGGLFIWFSLWAMAVGAGLVVSVLVILIPETEKIMPVIMLPLLLVSGVIFPLNFLPPLYQEYLLLNPIVHGLELLRFYFFANYQPVAGVDVRYLWMWSFSLLALGLMLHLRFHQRMKVL